MTGRRFVAEQVDPATLPPGLRALFAWLETTGHDVDIPALRGRFPEVQWHSYEGWLQPRAGHLP